MSRFSTSLLYRTGLSIAVLLAAIPTQICTATQAESIANSHSQTLVALEPPAKTSNSAPTTQTPPQPKSDSSPVLATPVKPATGNSPLSPVAPSPIIKGETTLTTPVKPTSGNSPLPTVTPRPIHTGEANLATPTTPLTGGSPIPTVIPSQISKPVAASNKQPPIEKVVTLVLKLKEKRVYVYRGDKLIEKYPVAIGKKGWETPVGEWQVMEKIKNPAWTSFKTGEVSAPGKENPLGSRWIGFWTDGKDVIGFHGTSNLKSIGTAASHGCVRMFNRDVKALFPLVKVGTTVKVVDE